MKTYLTLLSFLVISVIFISSCNKDNGTTGPDATNQPTNQSGQPIPAVSGTNSNVVLATIAFDFAIPSPVPLTPVTYNMGYAQLNGDAGDVQINGTSLTKNETSGLIYYNSFNQLSPSSLSSVNFNGSAHNWTVAGKGSITGFTASVSSPSTFSVTQPTANATVSKSSGLTVRWNNTNSTDSVLIQITPTTGSGNTIIKQGIVNNGTYTFSSADLGNLTGTVNLQVVKWRYSLKNVGSVTYPVISEVVKSIIFNLN